MLKEYTRGKNVTLNDLEDPDTTEGECAVIKVSKNSVVSIENNDVLELNGNCKNIIKGREKSTIIFNKSSGKYIINGNKTAIAGDGIFGRILPGDTLVARLQQHHVVVHCQHLKKMLKAWEK